MKKLLADLAAISREAGDAILAIYEHHDPKIEIKEDNSPLTEADLAAHKIIVESITQLCPDIPVLSEESAQITYAERARWERYFLVDPLDGTKEFISRNGEFTVNIALIDHGIPILGIVFVPVANQLYAGYQDGGTTYAHVERAGMVQPIRTRELRSRLRQGKALTVVASRRHGGDALAKCLARLDQRFPEVETTNMGSSLKLCLVAEGKADFYPRLAPTSEWDTAAAQAIVEAAGGLVVDTRLMPLRYNQKDSVLNPYFYVLGDVSFPWQDVLVGIDAT